jgi:hypothetical protein
MASMDKIALLELIRKIGLDDGDVHGVSDRALVANLFNESFETAES